MTFETLLGRLQRLKNLAEIVAADDYAKTLQEILGDLESDREPEFPRTTEVDPALLVTLRRRLTGR